MANYVSSYTGSQHDQYVTASQIINLVYPVGSIYISANNVNPSTLFGGTWEQIKGKFLLGEDNKHTIGSTGGKESYVADDMPAHTHTRGTMEIEGKWWTGWNTTVRGFHDTTCQGAFYLGQDNSRPGRITSEDGYANNSSHNGYPWLKASGGWTGETSQSGTNTTATIVPPYLTVSIWKRIS